MKKLLYLFVACCLTMAASAQKLTEKDLQGNWKLAKFDAQGLTVDVAAEKVDLSPELKAQLTPEQIQQMEGGMAQAFEMFKMSYLNIDGKNLTLAMGPEEEKGTFEVAQKDGKNILNLTTSGGMTKDINIALVNKMLTLTQTEGGGTVNLTFSKE